MLNVQMICVGKLKERFYIDGAAEYQKRLGGYCRFTLTELPEERLPENPSPAQIEAALRREGTLILQRLPKSCTLTALCIEGALCSSEALAEKLETWAGQGRSHLAFVIGSSFGLHPDVKAAADWRLSMSPMTFPHHLARVMLLEQLYRGFKITEGSGYHK
ncbi:MAG: 23S rRNA (pseudouridine(1915)-N(3))-methyltransferase RlmH [Pseudoflavonifractor sp.]